MIRITFLVHSLEIGGAEVQLSVLARGLDRNKFEPTVICFHDAGALSTDLEKAGITVITLGLCGYKDIVGFVFRLIRAVRNSQPHIVYSYLDFPNAIAALIKPWVSHSRLIWGIRTSDMKLENRSLSWRTWFSLERLLSRTADLIICNSWAGRQHLKRNQFHMDALIVVENGIDTELFYPNPASRTRYRVELNYSDDDIVIGLVARLDPVKDHETFLRAAAELAGKLPAARFICIGGGPAEYTNKLKTLGDSLGLGHRLIWTGARSDVSDLLNAMDIATLCSAYGEGFPNAVGEGMATALPFVTTKVGDAHRVVGDTGIVVPTASPIALAAAWHRLAELSPKERAASGAAARARIVSKFPQKLMIDKTSELLHRLQLQKLDRTSLLESP